MKGDRKPTTTGRQPKEGEVTSILVNHHGCGTVELDSEDERVVISHDRSSGSSQLVYLCPQCGLHGAMWIPHDVVVTLAELGVHVAHFAETLPPLTVAGIASFLDELERWDGTPPNGP